MTNQTPTALSDVDRLWETKVGSDIAFLLARANARTLSRVNATLRPYGLKARSFALLNLAVEGERLSQREVAEFLHLDPSQVVALVDGLERGGWVERVPDPNDRRAKLLIATDAGRAHLAEARAATSADEAEQFSAFGAEALYEFVDALRRIAQPDPGD